MARKQEWTVRVINWGTDSPRENEPNRLRGLWVEQLRYLGHASEIASFEDRQVLEFYCPNLRDLDSRVWADQNASRMRSFGIDAVAAPKWDKNDHPRALAEMRDVSRR